MHNKIRAGHFATLFSEGLEPEEEPPPTRPPPVRAGRLAPARRLASLLTRRPQPEPLQTRESAAT